jgi:hypothetical protein
MTLPPAPTVPSELLTLKQYVRRFVALQKERADLKARLQLIEEELAPLATLIGDAFEASGTRRERVDGLTVYLAYTTWARPKHGDMRRLVAALRETEWRDLVTETVNIATLSAAVRERLRDAQAQGLPEAQALPPGVYDALQITVDRTVKAITAATPRGKGEKDAE